MLWNGKITLSHFKKLARRRAYNRNIATRTLAFPALATGRFSVTKMFFYVPKGWEFILFDLIDNQIASKKVLFLFSEVYYFRLPILTELLYWEYGPCSRTFSFRNQYISHFYRMYFHRITRVFQSFTRVFFLKLAIRGKGYYIYKDSRRTVTHQFGHSHRTYIPTFFVVVRFLTKKSVIIFGSSKKDVVGVGQRIRRSKYMNVFTGRGVRFNRQSVYKKTGKVSAYR